MKTLGIGIFIILAIGVLYFTMQLVKNPGVIDLKPAENTNTASAKDNTFFDIDRSITFTYPKTWAMVNPNTMPGFAPVFKAAQAQGTKNAYAAIMTQYVEKKATVTEDIQSFTNNFPGQAAIEKIIGSSADISVRSSKEMTYKSGVRGFVLSFSAQPVMDANQSAQNTQLGNSYSIVEGSLYAYYAQGKILVALAVEEYDATVSMRSAEFLNQAEAAFDTLATQ